MVGVRNGGNLDSFLWYGDDLVIRTEYFVEIARYFCDFDGVISWKMCSDGSWGSDNSVERSGYQSFIRYSR